MKKRLNTISWLLPTTFLPSGIFLVLTIAHVGIRLSIPAIVILLYFEIVLLSFTVTHLLDGITTKKSLFCLWQSLGFILLLYVGISTILQPFSIGKIGSLPLLNDSDSLLQILTMVILCISSLLPFTEMQMRFDSYLTITKQKKFTYVRFFILQFAGCLIRIFMWCLLGIILYRYISYQGIQLLSLITGASYLAIGIYNIWILFLNE